MKLKITFMVILSGFILITGAVAQDSSTLQFSSGDSWEFEVTSGEFEYTASGGTVSSGETYTFEITSDVSDSGSYDMEYDGPDGRAAGTMYADEFGADAIYADWDYWETNAAADVAAQFGGFFSADDVDIDNGGDKFTATVDLTDFVIEISYFKSTGVLAKLGLTSDLVENMVVENITGAEAQGGFLPGFGFYMTFIGFLALVPIARRLRN